MNQEINLKELVRQTEIEFFEERKRGIIASIKGLLRERKEKETEVKQKEEALEKAIKSLENVNNRLAQIQEGNWKAVPEEKKE